MIPSLSNLLFELQRNDFRFSLERKTTMNLLIHLAIIQMIEKYKDRMNLMIISLRIND